MTLWIFPPRQLNQDFIVGVDNTMWDKTYTKTKHKYFSPAREAASFGAFNNALLANYNPINDDIWGNMHEQRLYGIYILAFDYPSRRIYVGTAGFSHKSPEGIEKRIRKHRLKATGSRVGQKYDGVHHPKLWRHLARERSSLNQPDNLNDCRYSVGILEGNIVPSDADLTPYESLLVRNAEQLHRLFIHFWPQHADGGNRKMCLTAKTKNYNPNLNLIIEYIPPPAMTEGFEGKTWVNSQRIFQAKRVNSK